MSQEQEARLEDVVYVVPGPLFAEIYTLLGEFPGKFTLGVLNKMAALRPQRVEEAQEE